MNPVAMNPVARARRAVGPAPGRHIAAAAARAPITRRALAGATYVVVGLPLAVVSAVAVLVSTALGVALTVTFVGLPLLALGGIGARRLGAIRRHLAARLLGERIEPPPPLAPGPGWLGWLQASLRDPYAWKARAYLVVQLPVAIVTFYLAAIFWLDGLLCLTYPIWWAISGPSPRRPGHEPFLDAGALVGRGSTMTPHFAHDFTMQIGGVYLDTWPRLLAVSLVGLAALVAAPWVVQAAIWPDRLLMRSLLGPGTTGQRVRELEWARAHIAEDAASTLRRIERDLHDGTQAQLVTLAMSLGAAKEKLEHRAQVRYDPDGALVLIDTAHQQAKEALVDLRNIARGIHPPALDVGLDDALATLVARSAVAATLHVDIPLRPAQAIETIAYFSAAELLANAARHSQAHHVNVNVVAAGPTLTLTVTDDGIGGAKSGAGSGLRGLADRAGAVDGRLHVNSPPGGPTVVTIELPLHP